MNRPYRSPIRDFQSFSPVTQKILDHLLFLLEHDAIDSPEICLTQGQELAESTYRRKKDRIPRQVRGSLWLHQINPSD